MTQKDSLLEMLNKGEWRCGSEFLQAYLPEYRSLINKLRRVGYQIVTRSCENPGHFHKSKRMQEWHLLTTKTPPPGYIGTPFTEPQTFLGTNKTYIN